MIQGINQGPPIKAEKTRFFVTSELEFERNGRYLAECSVISLPALWSAKGVGNPMALSEEYRQQLVAQEFDDRWQRNLNGQELSFARKILEFGKQIPGDLTGRFRVYGGIVGDDQEVIVLVTEFEALAEDYEFWRRFEQVRKDTQGHCFVLRESPDNDHSWRVDAAGIKIPGSDKYGPRYGKLMRQVELSWRIEKLTPTRLVRRCERYRRLTEPLWNVSGVGVC